VTELAREIRERFPGKTVWLYTGFTFEQIKELEIMKYLDVLVDGEFEIDKIDLQAKWRGSINQRVIDVPQTLKLGQIVLACD
jgi:anaerobic ribonucleoside-triphosphate reductase activating protein